MSGTFSRPEEHLTDPLAPGKLADVVVLSQNLLTCPETKIRGTRVEMTCVGGQLLYER